jgi:hypothetical protein
LASVSELRRLLIAVLDALGLKKSISATEAKL